MKRSYSAIKQQLPEHFRDAFEQFQHELMQVPPKMAKYTDDNATGVASAAPNGSCQEKTQYL